MANIKDKTLAVMRKNRREKDGFQYTVPSADSYPYQWFWDSCFHAIILSHFNIEDAKKELRSLTSKQFENGLFPHVIYWEKHEVLPVNWGVEGTSSLAQPPIIAYSVWQIFQKDKDRGFLTEMYPKLAKYYRHLLTRDPRVHHLVGIINPDESGEDNSPRFDLALGLPPIHEIEENNRKRFELFDKNIECKFDAANCMSNFFWVKDVAFNSYLVENLAVLADIAHELNQEDDTAYFTGQVDLVKDAMRKLMYEDGIFWTTCGPDYEKVKIKTWAMFAPLVANIYTKEEAENLVRNHLKNGKEFRTKYLVPTVATNEESFNPNETKWGDPWQHPNWRGPIWMASNWFLYRALKNYNFEEEAEMIKKHSFELLEKSGFREYYHPETGIGMGAEGFTWGGLMVDMG